MSITADPLFIAAEIEWRYDIHRTGPALELPLPEEHTNHRHHTWRRALNDRLHHRHQGARPTTPRVA